VLVLCAGLFLAGCGRRPGAQDGVSVEHEVTPRPPRVGRARVALRVSDAAGRPLSGARVELEGNMSHAGMRPVFGEATESGPGRYESALEFTMGGDWVILVRLTLPDGRKIERQFDVKGVQSG
jgi:Cu(I)/Ag(I) efflux system membrane fusion protein